KVTRDKSRVKNAGSRSSPLSSLFSDRPRVESDPPRNREAGSLGEAAANSPRPARRAGAIPAPGQRHDQAARRRNPPGAGELFGIEPAIVIAGAGAAPVPDRGQSQQH